MRHASLFSGIGGFDLAASWMGWENVFQCEIDPYCQAVLKKNFPQTKRYGDIKQLDATPYRGTIDILTGGFPCQPYSLAGKRKGNKDDRHLWPEMLRVITEVRPTYIVAENVYGLINWSKGLVFEQVQTDLENIGYEVTPVILPACSANAPHKRDRIWFIAHASGKPCNISVFEWRQIKTCNPNAQWTGSSRTFTNPNKQRLPVRIQAGWRINKETNASLKGCESTRIYPTSHWGEFPTQSAICGRDDGIPNRVDRIKSLGNAIVPQVAHEIFKAIVRTEQEFVCMA